MREKNDAELLAEFANRRSEQAFQELVRRYADLVYSAALRQVGEPDAAKDVSQRVFCDLAAKAREISVKSSNEISLAGWLFRSTRFVAMNHRRAELRRLIREKEAMQQLNENPSAEPRWSEIKPVLDEAMAELPDADRDALLLRFFKERDFRSVGEALGVSDDAAQKRVSRALEKLRDIFARRGVTISAAGLSAVLSANAVSAAPAAVVTLLSAAAVGSGASVSIVTSAKVAAMTTLQKSIFGAALVGAVGLGIYEAREVARLRNQMQVLQSERAKPEETSAPVASPSEVELARLQADKSELLRLRSEVGFLRQQTNQLGVLREENRKLQEGIAVAIKALEEKESEELTPERKMVYAKMNDARAFALGLILFASENQNRLPEQLSHMSNFLSRSDPPPTMTNDFDLLVTGSLSAVTNPSQTIVVRESRPTWFNGRLGRAYGFADGHVEWVSEPPEGFEVWERKRLPESQ